MAVERASRLAAGVRAAAAVPANVLYRPYAAMGLIAVAAGLLALLAPRLAVTQWLRFTDPYGDHPPYSPMEFKVEPGDTRVLYGSGLDVRATVQGGAVEQLELVLDPAKARPPPLLSPLHLRFLCRVVPRAEEVLPMFPEAGGVWRATVADVTAPGSYFVRAHGSRGARSRQVHLRRHHGAGIEGGPLPRHPARLHPPPAVRRPAAAGWLGRAPRDARRGLGHEQPPAVRRVAPLLAGRRTSHGRTSHGSARHGSARHDVPGDKPFQSPGLFRGRVVARLAPTAPNAAEAAGAFVITGPGKMELKVADAQGQASRDTFTAPVSVLSDDRPFVRILEPKANSYATPDVTLNISLVAEDDYGVSRLQVFRGLNESRVRPTDVPVPPSQPTRLPA